MNVSRLPKFVLFLSFLATVMLTVDVGAQERSSRRRGRGLWGDYRVKMKFGEREFESILSFSRDAEGKRTAQWISLWGISELKDVTFEEGQLSFAQERKNREGETVTSTFKGTIKEGKLSGTMSSERGEVKVEGERAARMPRIVGSWEMKFKMGEREITTKIIVKTDKEGKISVEWPSERVKHTISEAKYERGKLTFKTKGKMEEHEWESTFEASIPRNNRNAITGTIKSERGELKIEGKRVGADVIGTWMLDLESERGPRKQRLRINGDMSALYGSHPIKKIDLKDGKVSFKIVMQFGERKFESDFQATLKEKKLTGEVKSSRGTRKFTGTKLERRRPQRRSTI